MEQSTPKVFESEYRFCLILWESEPVTCAKLASLCKEKLGWSRTTTYTVIKRLSERGVIRNEQSTITSLFSKDDIQRADMTELLQTRFEGSLPAFVNAFAKIGHLTEKEINEIRAIIERSGKES